MSTYLDIVESDDTNPSTVKEPAKRWRNWWHSMGDNPSGPWRDGDQENPQCDPTPYPSKDVAEQKADEQLEKMLATPHANAELLVYLGAFPEGERP